MGSSGKEEPAKHERFSAPPVDYKFISKYQEGNNCHGRPDWAAIQGYCGPRLAILPYVNGVAVPDAWRPPQFFIPPCGDPYATFYAYAHPGVHSFGTPLNMDKPTQSSGDSGGFVHKLKEYDDNADEAADHRVTQSEDSSCGSRASNEIPLGTGRSGKKISPPGYPGSAVAAGNDKAQKYRMGKGSEMVTDGTESMSTALELKDSSGFHLTTTAQNEGELKQERRKQSNRESARRLRLRRLAESDELANKVQALTSENAILKSDISKLMHNSKQLKQENVALEKLKEAELRQGQ